jgi:hypothetical protein
LIAANAVVIVYSTWWMAFFTNWAHRVTLKTVIWVRSEVEREGDGEGERERERERE